MRIYENAVLKLAKHWVAGSSIYEVISHAKNANSARMDAIINYLGEHLIDTHDIEACVNEYERLVDAIHSNGIRGSISLKLTQIGLDVDYEECLSNARRIVDYAYKQGIFTWIDMESFDYYEDTLDIYLTLIKEYKDYVGVAYQAYIKDNALDIMSIIDSNGIVRLVKGAYREDPHTVYRSKRYVNLSFMRLMHILFEHADRFAIATHDKALIDYAIGLSSKSSAEFEFQMLKGIRDDLKSRLVEQGFKVAEYIPYGNNVSAYAMRRIKERPANLLLLARSLL